MEDNVVVKTVMNTVVKETYAYEHVKEGKSLFKVTLGHAEGYITYN